MIRKDVPMFKRLRMFYVKLYEHVRMWMERHDPKPLQHVNDPPEVSDWRPASAHTCPLCTWQWMIWDVLVEQWVCPHCGTSRYPSLSVTEKRPIVRAPSIQAEKQPKPVFATGQLSFLHKRHMIVNGSERLANGLPRLAWKNGQCIDTGQLKPLTPAEHKLLMDIFQEDRRTG